MLDSARKTQDYISIIDIISVILSQKNPHSTWKRLYNKFQSELCEFCCEIKFDGPGQRETPCILLNKVDLLIKRVLPGARLSLSRKQEILEYFGIKDKLLIRSYIEEEIHQNLIKAFSHHQYIQQFAVLSYRIDLYFPTFKLAIECDEHHEDYNQESEITRHENITRELNCQWIRYKPYDKDFDIFVLINEIMRHVETHKLYKSQSL